MNGKIEDELLKENLDLINDILVNDFKFINNKEDLFIVGLECAYKLLSKSNKDNFSDILKRFLKVTIVNEIFNNLNWFNWIIIYIINFLFKINYKIYKY